jgi:hypothetical protein
VAEQIALAVIAAHLNQTGKLHFGLDPFGHYRFAERAPELQHGRDDGIPLRAHADLIDKGAVDLDLIDGEPVQHAKGRVARAEIIEADLHAKRTQLFEVRNGDGALLDENAFGDFDDKLIRVDAGVEECFLHQRWKVGLRKLSAGDVDVHR